MRVHAKFKWTEKAHLFHEIYGNLLIREKTFEFIQQQASLLIRMVTDESGALAKIFNFKHLKFRERDDLEFVFKYWRDEKKSFDGDKLWCVFFPF